MTRVVLGSASPGRLKVLRQAGIDPLVVVSGVDEDAVMAGLGPDTPPAEAVCALAHAKAGQVAADLDRTVAADSLVIGCDSMLEVDARLVGKPGSADAAQAQWHAIGGRSGRLHTGHCLLRLCDGAIARCEVECASTTVDFTAPTATELQAYIDSGEPLHVAGGFTIDGLGGWFIDRIDGDPSNVVGLSLPLVRRLIARMGLSLAALWAVP